ncbi:MAG: hypothetical protein ABW096_14430 [Candidatus Thiodiazotropha sp.]
MMSEDQNPDRSKRRVEALKVLDDHQFELWKFYENRADALGARMWSIGIWQMSVIAATLSVPFAAKFIEPQSTFPYLVAKVPAATALLAVFGILFCVYSYLALHDLRDHIKSNWRKAGYILEGTWESEWEGRKSHGWNILFGVGILALVGFFGFIVLAIMYNQT